MAEKAFKVGEDFLYYGNSKRLHGNRGTVLKIYPPDAELGHEVRYRCKVEGYATKKRLPAYKMRKIKVIWEV